MTEALVFNFELEAKPEPAQHVPPQLELEFAI